MDRAQYSSICGSERLIRSSQFAGPNSRLNITGRLGQSRNSRDKRDADGKPEFLSLKERNKERKKETSTSLGFTMLFLGVNNHKEVPSINKYQ
jgi:hypothetical protein